MQKKFQIIFLKSIFKAKYFEIKTIINQNVKGETTIKLNRRGNGIGFDQGRVLEHFIKFLLGLLPKDEWSVLYILESFRRI